MPTPCQEAVVAPEAAAQPQVSAALVLLQVVAAAAVLVPDCQALSLARKVRAAARRSGMAHRRALTSFNIELARMDVRAFVLVPLLMFRTPSMTDPRSEARIR